MDDACTECAGAGRKKKIDIMSAIWKTETCEACRGTGQKPQKNLAYEETGEGIMFVQPKGVFGWWEKLKEHRKIAWIEVIIYPLLDSKTGQPQVLPNEVALKWVQILRMRTESKWRRKGVMTELLNNLREHLDITRVETDWNDSSAAGRNFLIGCGFKQDGETLLWRQGMEKEWKG